MVHGVDLIKVDTAGWAPVLRSSPAPPSARCTPGHTSTAPSQRLGPVGYALAPRWALGGVWAAAVSLRHWASAIERLLAGLHLHGRATLPLAVNAVGFPADAGRRTVTCGRWGRARVSTTAGVSVLPCEGCRRRARLPGVLWQEPAQPESSGLHPDQLPPVLRPA
jgi:hypothetical protein